MIDETMLKAEESAVYTLRALYRRYGYLPYRMVKFEEYDFYARNKDFLVSDRIITFTDSRGRLLALKPDVTLSIIKNGEDRKGCAQRLCYSEKVFRASGSLGQFKEITQAGLECIGDLDLYDLFEVVSLAAQSLAALGRRWVLNLSHLGLLNALLAGLGGDGTLERECARCIAERNVHELAALCRASGVEEKRIEELCFFAKLHGPLEEALTQLAPYCESETAKNALKELRMLCKLLTEAGHSDNIRFDFSVVNNRKYYNGLVFQGFLEDIPESVLTGGRYDRLMERMGRASSGIGFAVYLDRLDDEADESAPDVDVLLLCDDPTEAARKASALRQEGESVSVQRAIPDKLRYGRLLDLRGGKERA